MMVLGFALAALIGLSLGMLGGGGSILTVPIFVYVLGFEAKQAIAMSLVVVGVTSLFGAVGHWRSGNVNLRVAIIFGAIAMAGAYLGARLAVFFSGQAQLLLFGVIMALAAVFMFRGRKARPGAGTEAERQLSLPLIVAQAFAVGIMTGLVGVGGGFMIVPALVLLAGLPMKQAVGTSLLVITLNTFAGFLGYLGEVQMRWLFIAAFTGVAIIGSVGGAALVRFVPQDTLRRSFAVLLVVMSAFVLYQNRAVLIS